MDGDQWLRAGSTRGPVTWLTGPPGEPRLRTYPLPGTVGLQAVGEVDAANQRLWAAAVEPLFERGVDVYLDLSGLTFIGVAGSTTVAVAAQRLPAGRRLVLRRPPVTFGRVLNVMWPDLAQIEVHPC
jgi:anti-anti-sigma regulatory factor